VTYEGPVEARRVRKVAKIRIQHVEGAEPVIARIRFAARVAETGPNVRVSEGGGVPAHIARDAVRRDIGGAERAVLVVRLQRVVPARASTAHPHADVTAVVRCHALPVDGAIAVAQQEEDVDHRRAVVAPQCALHPTAEELLGRIAPIIESAALVQHR
jgi:hypothetical protein